MVANIDNNWLIKNHKKKKHIEGDVHVMLKSERSYNIITY